MYSGVQYSNVPGGRALYEQACQLTHVSANQQASDVFVRGSVWVSEANNKQVGRV